MSTDSGLQEGQALTLQRELESRGRLSKRKQHLLVEPWADLWVRERSKE